MHGGTQPRGLAHHATKTGILSKDMPTRILADFEAARSDPDLVALREELALVQAREADLLRRVDTGEAGVLWQRIRAAMREFRRAQRADDAPAAAAALRDMEQAMDEGVQDYLAWQELLRAIEQRRRLAETERKRLEAIQQTLSADRAMLWATALLDSVRRHVDDRRALAAVAADFSRAVEGLWGRGTDDPAHR